MTQQLSKQTTSSTPARNDGVIVVDSAPETVCALSTGSTHYPNQSSGAETFQFHMDRFIKHGECSCPVEFLEPVRPYGCNLTIFSCPFCKKENRRVYD